MQTDVSDFITYAMLVSDVYSRYNPEIEKGTTSSIRPKICNTDFNPNYYDNRLTNLMNG